MNKFENILANGEIAHYEQFLLLPQCLQKSSAAEASESVCIWEGLHVSHLQSNFYVFVADNFRKLLWQNVKLLKMSNCSFCQQRFP